MSVHSISAKQARDLATKATNEFLLKKQEELKASLEDIFEGIHLAAVHGHYSMSWVDTSISAEDIGHLKAILEKYREGDELVYGYEVESGIHSLLIRWSVAFWHGRS